MATADGARSWRLTEVENDADHGSLIPVFSPDRSRLLWAERTHGANLFNLPQVAGYWVLKTADFIDDVAGPRLANARVVSVPGDAFNETGGFAPDSRPFVFTSDGPAQNFWKSQFVLADAEAPTSFEVQTELGAYKEHPRFTPDGRITWMSNVGSTLQGEDWWVMNADGTAKTRLSYFNEPSSHFNGGQLVTCGPIAASNWSGDGSVFSADVQTNLLSADGEILHVELTCP